MLASALRTPPVDWFALSPALDLLGALALCLLTAVLVPPRWRKAVAGRIAGLAFIAAFVDAAFLFARSTNGHGAVADAMLRDRLGALAAIIITGAGLATVWITYAQRVREMLEEFSAISGGKIVLNVVDPVAFSEDEDRANEAGLRGLPVSASESVYFGLVGTNATDGKEIIPIFDPTAERFLEYDIARTIYSLAHPKKKIVGLMSTLPVEGLPFDPLTGQPSRQQPWQVIKELKTLFEVRNVPTTATEIPADVDLLMLIHPKQLGDATLRMVNSVLAGNGEPPPADVGSVSKQRVKTLGLTAFVDAASGAVSRGWR